MVLKVLAKLERHPKEEVKLFQFADDMVLNVENSKHYTGKGKIELTNSVTFQEVL